MDKDSESKAERTGFPWLSRQTIVPFLVSFVITTWFLSGRRLFPIQSAKAPVNFAWSNLEGSTGLIWSDCDDGFQCGKLRVPLNYSDPHGYQADIALIRFPATVSRTSKAYRGPVLFNPGGPGGSGVDLVRREGKLFALILGPQYDIVGFDPRGIGRSTPLAAFYSSAAQRVTWHWAAPYPINASQFGIPASLAHAQVTNLIADTRDKHQPERVLAHINTDHTARDMLSIVRAHGREKILYWGFSYGSVLGATFASMFPDNIERLLIDGVMLAEDYYKGTWLTNLIDTSKSFQGFFDGCASAGPDRCSFYEPTSPEIRRKWDILQERLISNPVPIFKATSQLQSVSTKCHQSLSESTSSSSPALEYGVVDIAILRAVVFQFMYKPYALYQPLASALQALYADNDALPLYRLLGVKQFECECDVNKPIEGVVESGGAVRCQDSDVVPSDLESTIAHIEKTKAVDGEWWDMWSPIRVGCAGYPKAQQNIFRGPIGANTSHPLLIIGNTADPVTPLKDAIDTSKLFPGSSVLIQNSFGHCSLSAVSTCTISAIRQYFEDGTLPENGTTCEVESELFPPVPYSVEAIKKQESISQLDKDKRRLFAIGSELVLRMSNKERGFPLGI